MDPADWKPSFFRWVRIYALGLLLAPLVWALLLRPPSDLHDVVWAFLLTLLLGWPWIVLSLIAGGFAVTTVRRRTADLLAIGLALAVAAGASQIGLIAG